MRHTCAIDNCRDTATSLKFGGGIIHLCNPHADLLQGYLHPTPKKKKFNCDRVIGLAVTGVALVICGAVGLGIIGGLIKGAVALFKSL